MESEIKLRKILKKAKIDSCKVYPTNKYVQYELNNVFGRFIISAISFGKGTTSRLMGINDSHNPYLEKWESEMRKIRLEPDRETLINILNHHEPILSPADLRIPDVREEIDNQTIIRMQNKYIAYSGAMTGSKKSYAKFLAHVTKVYYRYMTYDSWSQCWTMLPEDRPDFKSKELKTIEMFGAPFNTQADTYIFGTIFPDTDNPFGGIGRYKDLYKKILKDNKKGIFYNIQINPPYVESIMDDLVPIISKLKSNKNKTMVMFPAWTDSKSFQSVKAMYDNEKIIDKSLNMFTNEVIFTKNTKSYLWW